MLYLPMLQHRSHRKKAMVMHTWPYFTYLSNAVDATINVHDSRCQLVFMAPVPILCRPCPQCINLKQYHRINVVACSFTYLCLSYDLTCFRKAIHKSAVHWLWIEILSMLYNIIMYSRWHCRANMFLVSWRWVIAMMANLQVDIASVSVDVSRDTSTTIVSCHTGMQSTAFRIWHLMLDACILTTNILEGDFRTQCRIADVLQVVSVTISCFDHSTDVHKQSLIIH